MGKSPGKWIKTVLFGKKTSKANHATGKELKKSASQKENLVRENATACPAPALNPPSLSSNVSNTADIDENVSRSVNKETPVIQQDALGSENLSSNLEPSSELSTYNDTGRIREENAATKAQAAYRGYLARRAFKALKGIIRLQALIRGHLVRRQAVSTLHCLIGIIKLQAIARGAKIRGSDIGLEVQQVCVLSKLQDGKLNDFSTQDTASQIVISSTNVFVRTLIAAQITMKPLRVQYDSEDPSSALNWLDRWSSSNVWRPVPQPKKASESKSLKKQEQSHTTEVGQRRPKHSVRRIRGSFDGNTSVHSNSESENPRRNPKKSLIHSAEPENPQHELEKVKRSLRKVHSPAVGNHGESEACEKPRLSQGKTSSSAKHDVSGANEPNPPGKVLNSAKHDVSGANEINPPIKVSSSAKHDVSSGANEINPPIKVSSSAKHDVSSGANEIVKEETTKEVNMSIEEPVVVSQPAETMNAEEHLVASETVEISNGDHSVMPTDSCEKDRNDGPIPDGEEMKSNDESLQNENQKSNRRSSFPAKQEVEDGPQNTPKLPSYMAATKSAKAKLKGQNSPRFSQDGNEKISATRRHSLPSATNGKLSKSSPRTQKPVNGGGKGGILSDKARDGKAGQTEWRR